MLIRKSFKFRLKPSKEDTSKLLQFVGNRRFIWNKALAWQKQSFEQSRKLLKYSELAKLLVDWKKEEPTEFLTLSPSQSLQQALMDLDKAFKMAFKKKGKWGFPKFKKRGRYDSYREPVAPKIENDTVFLPKIGPIKFIKSREIEGKIKNATISTSGGQWYIAFQTEQEKEEQVHPKQGSEIGIDLGVRYFATLSNGTVYPAISPLRKKERQLQKAQRTLSRKVKGSNNFKKQVLKLGILHRQIKNIRLDYLHKISTDLCKNHAVIYIEDLQIANMSSSAKGTVENWGVNVKAKSGLNKSILDQGWYEFCRQLEYKQQWLGGKVIKINPKYTSQQCVACGYISRDNRKTQSCFQCQSCGHTNNADVNAAQNIHAAGRAVYACGDIRLVAV